MVIDLVFEIIRYLARALGRDRERPERLFKDFVEPIQEDLLRIQEDYTRSFSDLADMIADESTTTADIEAHVRKQRKKFNPVRMTTGELAISLTELFNHRSRKKKPPEGSASWLLHQYTDAVIDYLYGTFTPSERGPDGPHPDITQDTDLRIETRYTDFMRVVKIAGADSGQRAELAQMVSDTERELERSWYTLASRFGRLKATCLA